MKKKQRMQPEFLKDHAPGGKIVNYWNDVMRSTACRMSRGAQNIDKLITWAHKDNWRRKQKGKKK